MQRAACSWRPTLGGSFTRQLALLLPVDVGGDMPARPGVGVGSGEEGPGECREMGDGPVEDQGAPLYCPQPSFRAAVLTAPAPSPGAFDNVWR